MKNYNQLDLSQRYRIEALWSTGMTRTSIAEAIGVHKCTISRELKRNGYLDRNHKIQYYAQRAQKLCDKREVDKNRHRRLTKPMLLYIRKCLKEEKWSPEIISVKGKEKFGCFVSHEWIYQYIWTAKHSGKREFVEDKDLHRYLRHHGRRSKRCKVKENRGCLRDRVGISERPRIVEKRERYGDIEVDFIMSKGNKVGLAVLTDRATLKTRLVKLKTKRAQEVAERIIRAMRSESMLLYTFTFDNDLGFAEHIAMSQKLGVDTYFTRPYTSQDKGTVENRIGQLRRFLPKGCDIQAVHHNTIRSIERKLNNRPVRKFGYLSPIEKFNQLVAVDT